MNHLKVAGTLAVFSALTFTTYLYRDRISEYLAILKARQEVAMQESRKRAEEAQAVFDRADRLIAFEKERKEALERADNKRVREMFKEDDARRAAMATLSSGRPNEAVIETWLDTARNR